MDVGSHSRFSQAIVQSVTDVDIVFEHVAANVSDSAAYWRLPCIM